MSGCREENMVLTLVEYCTDLTAPCIDDGVSSPGDSPVGRQICQKLWHLFGTL